MIRFGTLGAAAITPSALIQPCAEEPRAAVGAIAARDRTRAEEFANLHGIPKVLDSYQDVVEDDWIDAIYVPLHIPAHHEWTIKALRAGKHVLCEKSFASNATEAAEMAATALETGKVVMDAFHYRYHPVFMRAVEIYQTGMLGDIKEIEAAFHIAVRDPKNIRMNYETGGGVTMDIGCYPISWVRHITGEEPVQLDAEVEEGPPNVDVLLKTSMEFPDGIVATTSGDMRADARFTAFLKVTGSKGALHVVNPLVPQRGHEIQLQLGAEKTVEVLDRRPTYGYQLDAFLDAVENGAALLTDAQDAVAQMRVIDRCYEAVGLPLRGMAL